jgi:hypothetical protein
VYFEDADFNDAVVADVGSGGFEVENGKGAGKVQFHNV